MNNVITEYWVPVYDDAADKAAADKAAVDKAAADKTFSQADVDKIVATEKDRVKASYIKQLDALESLKKTANLSKKELEALNTQIDTLKKQTQSKEETQRDDLQKMQKKHNEVVSSIESERDDWKGKYTNSTIDRSIIDAAVIGNAYNTEQIVAILKPKTQLVEELDNDGKGLGTFLPKTTLKVKDSKGKESDREMTPTEAVKNLSDDDRYLNLFKSEKASGLGLKNSRKQKDKGLSMDTKTFMEDRKAAKKKK